MFDNYKKDHMSESARKMINRLLDMAIHARVSAEVIDFAKAKERLNKDAEAAAKKAKKIRFKN